MSFVCFLLTQKSWRPAEDVSDTIPRERALKSVSFQESVSVISDGPATMELESQQIQHGCPSNRVHSAVGVKVETPDSEVVQVLRFSEWDTTQMFSFLFYFLWNGAGVNTKTMTMKFILSWVVLVLTQREWFWFFQQSKQYLPEQRGFSSNLHVHSFGILELCCISVSVYCSRLILVFVIVLTLITFDFMFYLDLYEANPGVSFCA